MFILIQIVLGYFFLEVWISISNNFIIVYNIINVEKEILENFFESFVRISFSFLKYKISVVSKMESYYFYIKEVGG